MQLGENEVENTQAWNNLAYALLKTSCPVQAQAAAACAAGLAPDDKNYRETMAEIAGLARGADAAHCRPVACAALAP